MDNPENIQRRILSKAISFESWLANKGIPLNEICTETEFADFIGNAIFPTLRTKAEKGKQNSVMRRVQKTQELQAQYNNEIPSNVESFVPLDMNKESDRAYLRCYYRRKHAAETSK